MKILRFIAALFVSVGASSLGTAQPGALDVQLAREPATVTTTAKREFRGLLDGLREGRLHLRAATDGGEVGFSFAAAEIETLVLPGAEFEAQAAELWERSAFAEALPLLEALGRQRLRYLALLTPAQRRPLRLLVQASARAGNPLTTLGYVNQLLPASPEPAERAVLLDAQLDAHVQLGHTDEIQRLATAWCAEADPTGGSALGWKILAQLAHDAGDFERARWIALQPVVFAGFLPTEHLDLCYALAINSAHRLGDTAHAALLHGEMLSRGFAWPAGAAFAEAGRHYASIANTARAPEAEAVTDDATVTAPAIADAKLPLESVRKLVAPPPAR